MATYKSPEQADTDLHRILLTAVPADDKGGKTIVHLAGVMGVSRASIWYWIKNQSLPAIRAAKVVEISEGRVSLDQLHRFVYPS